VKERRRSVLHVDLDPFFVSVERSLDPSLRGRPVVIGGDGHGLGFVAAASEEARAAGVGPGQPLSRARELCPLAVFRRGDLDAYGRFSEEVTAVLLAASRRVERPSADEAFVDLTPEGPSDTPPARAAETVRDELQRRLGLDASLGLAGSRLAARIASAWAKPRGLLVVLPGYEHSFLAGKPIGALSLPPHLESALDRASLATLGQVADADDATLAAAVGAVLAPRLRAAARGEEESPIALAAPPTSLLEEWRVRDRRTDRLALEEILDALARRAARRLKPFRLVARAATVEVRRPSGEERRGEAFEPGLAGESEVAAAVREIASPLLERPDEVRSVQVRLSRLEPPTTQAPLFPASPLLHRAR
jgi:DNA polymerase-4